MPKIEGAPRHPSSRSAAAIDAAIARIMPRRSLEEWFGLYAANHRERLAMDLDIVQRFATPGAKLVEVGAAPLILTFALRDSGYDVAPVDLDPGRFAETIRRSDLEIHRCDIETEPLPFRDAAADLVLFNELLEHLRINPVFSLREVHRVLRPGGLLLLSTPNMRSLIGLSNLLLRQRTWAVCGDVYEEYAKLTDLGHMGHVREYAPGDVWALLGRLGFQLERMIFRGSDPRSWAEKILRIRPQFRQFVSYVARRVDVGA